MATHAALAPSRIPASTRLPSKTTHSFPTQCSSKRLDLAEFSGLLSSSGATFAKNVGDASFFYVLAAQLTPKVSFLAMILSVVSVIINYMALDIDASTLFEV